MILDTLANAAKYTGIRYGFSEAFGFLDHPDLVNLKDGRYEIMGESVFAMISHDPARLVSEGKLEGHRRYIDIQYVINGDETMGWSPRQNLASAQPYDPERDLEFFEGEPLSMIRVPPGSYTIFFPEDAHLPLVGEGTIHKVVVKVAID
jgi:YhcH/YjgK/YiaL family protein